MKCLVTGSAGFIGSHLCERLLARGDRVVCLDNFSTVDDRNIRALDSNPSFRLLARDVVEPIHLDVDAIYNFACPASPRRYQADPIQTLKTNVIGGADAQLGSKDVACRGPSPNDCLLRRHLHGGRREAKKG